jgi:hypothetical protein
MRGIGATCRPSSRVISMPPREATSIRYLTGRQSLKGRSVLYNDAWASAGEGPGNIWTVDNPHTCAVVEQIVRQRSSRPLRPCFVGSWDAHPNARAGVEAARLAFDRPVDGIWPSDHFGLVVDLQVSADRPN